MTNWGVSLDRDEIEKRVRFAHSERAAYLRQHPAALRVVGSVLAATVLTFAIVVGPHTESERQLAATVKMEQLANKLERAQRIPPETANQIAKMIDRPEFDCGRVSCRPSIEARSKTAHTRLLVLIGSRQLSGVSGSDANAADTAGR